MGNSNKTINYGTYIGDEVDGESRIMRHPEIATSKLTESPEEGLDTIWKLFAKTVKNHGNNKFLGSRKQISKDKFGDYEWKTYDEVHTLVQNFASGTEKLKFCPQVEHENGQFKFLGIYSKNREEWIVADLACHLNSITVVTFYDTLGDATIGYVLDQTKLTTILVESKNLKKLVKLKQDNLSAELLNIVLLDTEDESSIEAAKKAGLEVYSYADVLKSGEGFTVDFEPATVKTCATFCYTSGTTGVPKGAMITHGNITSAISAVNYSDLKFFPTDIHLSYLPLAHIMERITFTAAIFQGVQVGFFSGNAAKLVDDAQLLKPTIFVGVPRIYQRIAEVINDKIAKLGRVKRAMVNRAISTKTSNYTKKGQLTHSIWDRMVFGSMRGSLGGRVRVMVTGSAPISKDLLTFLKICFSCPIIEGFGQTESCAVGTLTHVNDYSLNGSVGGPCSSVELKLVDCPELGYTSKDKDENGNLTPRGEICYRGPVIFPGYFRDKENTEKAFDKDGWLHSGDVGMFLPNNSLIIKDRVKNIFKLCHGEYVAPEKIESVLCKGKYVTQIFVHGDSIESYVVAIIVPKLERVIEFLTEKGKVNVSKENVSTYFTDKDLLLEIVKDLDTLGRKNDLKGFEVVKKVHLTTEPFTVENNLLTPTMKLKRHEAKKKYVEQIKELYSEK